MGFIRSSCHTGIEEPPSNWPPLTKGQWPCSVRTISYTCEVKNERTKLKILKEGISYLQIFENLSTGRTDVSVLLGPENLAKPTGDNVPKENSE